MIAWHSADKLDQPLFSDFRGDVRMFTSALPDSTGCCPHSGWVPALHLPHLQVCLRSPPPRRVLVHGRHRLDHGSLLHHLRPSCERRHLRPGEWTTPDVRSKPVPPDSMSSCLPFLQFEGIPVHPHVGRFWEIIEKYKVTKFYTAPTAIRLLMKYGQEPLQK